MEWTWAEPARRQGLGMHPLVDWNTIGRTGGQVRVSGLYLSPGAEGRLNPKLLHELVTVLTTNTQDPDDITFAVWVGFHSSPAGYPRPTSGLLMLPDREYLLGTTTLDPLPLQAEDDDDLAQGVQLFWPSGREWLVASEIDLDSTVVGGTMELIDKIVRSASLEAYEVHLGDLFTVDATTAREPMGYRTGGASRRASRRRLSPAVRPAPDAATRPTVAPKRGSPIRNAKARPAEIPTTAAVADTADVWLLDLPQR
jgi:hypothetical protein